MKPSAVLSIISGPADMAAEGNELLCIHIYGYSPKPRTHLIKPTVSFVSRQINTAAVNEMKCIVHTGLTTALTQLLKKLVIL